MVGSKNGYQATTYGISIDFKTFFFWNFVHTSSFILYWRSCGAGILCHTLITPTLMGRFSWSEWVRERENIYSEGKYGILTYQSSEVVSVCFGGVTATPCPTAHDQHVSVTSPLFHTARARYLVQKVGWVSVCLALHWLQVPAHSALLCVSAALVVHRGRPLCFCWSS